MIHSSGTARKGSPDLPFSLDAFNTLPALDEEALLFTARRTSPGTDVLLLSLRQERVASVPSPARFGTLGAEWPLLAVRDDRDTVGLHALRDEVVHRRLRATLTQRQVVLGRAALVAMALDQHQVVVRFEPGRVSVEDLRVPWPDVVLVEVEVDLLQVRIRHELGWPWWRRSRSRWRRSRSWGRSCSSRRRWRRWSRRRSRSRSRGWGRGCGGRGGWRRWSRRRGRSRSRGWGWGWGRGDNRRDWRWRGSHGGGRPLRTPHQEEGEDQQRCHEEQASPSVRHVLEPSLLTTV